MESPKVVSVIESLRWGKRGMGRCNLFSVVGSGAQTAGRVPVCPGVTIATAISQKDGDYESIKTVTSVERNTVQIKYSSEQPPEKVGGGQRIRKLNTLRVLRVADLLDANLYEQIFGTNIPMVMPGTTAIGTST